MSTDTVHFTVDGDFITDTARRLWAEEDEPEKALRILRCMHGITEGQILDVLEGRSKLVGDSDSGIKLEPDTHTGKTAEQLFAKMRAERDEARDERADFAQMASGETVIVPSHDGAREIPRRKARPFMDTGAGRLHEDYEFDDRAEELPKGKNKQPKKLHIYRSLRDRFRASDTAAAVAKRGITETGETEEEKAAREERAWEAAREAAKKALTPTETITSTTGWLSPEGLFYPVLYGEHGKVAWALGLAEHPQDHGCKPPGWVRLGVNLERQYFFEDDTVKPTDAQRAAVRAYCTEKSIELPWWLRDEAE